MAPKPKPKTPEEEIPEVYVIRDADGYVHNVVLILPSAAAGFDFGEQRTGARLTDKQTQPSIGDRWDGRKYVAAERTAPEPSALEQLAAEDTPAGEVARALLTPPPE